MWKALLVFAVVLVGLGVATVAYIVPRVRVQESSTTSGGHVRVETPFGSVRVDKPKNLKPDLGKTPIYPAAEREKTAHNGAVVHFDWDGGEKQLAVAGEVYTTADSVEKVRAWYREQLPDWTVSKREITHVKGGLRRVIVIEERDGRTQITLSNVGDSAVN